MKSNHFLPPRKAGGGWRRTASVALGLAALAFTTSATAEEGGSSDPVPNAPAFDQFHYDRAVAAAEPGDIVVPTSRSRVLAVFKPTTSLDGAPSVAPETPEGQLAGPASVLFLDARGLPALQRPTNWREQLGLEGGVDYPGFANRPEIQYQVVPNPLGGEMVEVDRSFHPFLVGRLGPDGAIRLSCLRGEMALDVAETTRVQVEPAAPAALSPMAALMVRRQAAATEQPKETRE